MKSLGYSICLGKYDVRITDDIWLNTDIDYIKFDTMFLKGVMDNSKQDYYLKKKVEMINGYDGKCVPIFIGIDKQIEHYYFSSFPSSKILLGGSLYSEERKIILQKTKRQ